MKKTIKTLKKAIKNNKDESVTKSYLDQSLNKGFADQNKKIEQKFKDFKTEIISSNKKQFEEFSTTMLAGMESLIKDAVKTFTDENSDIKTDIKVLKTKVAILESK